VWNSKKGGLPEGIGKMENIEELLNGIKRICKKGKKELQMPKGDIGEFLEDVALATDLDKDNRG